MLINNKFEEKPHIKETLGTPAVASTSAGIKNKFQFK